MSWRTRTAISIIPIVVGLTATPPDMRGKPKEDVDRYKEFFGPVDYEVPTPAVVKDGFLAPYQDLVQFVRPTPDELAYVANADDQLYELVEELCQPARTQSRILKPNKGPSNPDLPDHSGSNANRRQFRVRVRMRRAIQRPNQLVTNHLP